MKWIDEKEYLVGIYKLKSFNISKKQNIAGFDLDGTIVTTKSNKVHSQDKDDWKFLYKTIPPNLKKIHKDGFQVVIFTNQKGIAKKGKNGETKIEEWKLKMESIAKVLNIPLFVMVSLQDDMYRKPNTCLWNRFTKYNKETSYYVGDAFGRPQRIVNDIVHKKDFADTDLKFAKNLGIGYYSPENFFLKINDRKFYNITYPFDIEKKLIKKRRLGKTTFKSILGNYQPFKPPNQKGGQYMVILCGFPGSGKSYYSKKYIEPYGYIRINRDELKTMKKCLIKCRDELDKKNSIIIDNTNPSIKSRSEFIELANEYGIQCDIILFNTPMDICIHNSSFRHVKSNGDTKKIPKIVYNIWKKQFQIPTKKEGFTNITNIDYVFEDNDNDYFKYYF